VLKEGNIILEHYTENGKDGYRSGNCEQREGTPFTSLETARGHTVQEKESTRHLYPPFTKRHTALGDVVPDLRPENQKQEKNLIFSWFFLTFNMGLTLKTLSKLYRIYLQLSKNLSSLLT